MKSDHILHNYVVKKFLKKHPLEYTDEQEFDSLWQEGVFDPKQM